MKPVILVAILLSQVTANPMTSQWISAEDGTNSSLLNKSHHNPTLGSQLTDQLLRWHANDQAGITHQGSTTHAPSSLAPPVIQIHCKLNGTTANCSDHRVRCISQLNLDPHITRLLLSKNDISEIPDMAFANLINLQLLDISYNRLSSLHENSFYNLSKLKTLHLDGNSLIMNNSTYPPGVFKPLVSLNMLYLNMTHTGGSENQYPDTALADLKNLTHLYIDGLPNQTFHDGFAQMHCLRHLIMAGGHHGWCRLGLLSKNTFSSLAQLHSLTMTGCDLNSPMAPDVFAPLTELKELNVSCNDRLHIETLLTAVSNLTKLKDLDMSNVINPYSPGVCATKQMAKNLPRSLIRLIAQSNSIESVEHDFLLHLPPELKYLDVSINRFVFGEYLQYLDKPDHLETLVINGGQQVWPLPHYFFNGTISQKKCNISGSASNPSTLRLPLPPKLRRIILKEKLTYRLTEFHFNETNSLEELILDGNNFPALIGPITGLIHLQNLSLVDCNIHRIAAAFFGNFSSLKRLTLRSNHFGLNAFRKGKRPLFKMLGNLEYLDIGDTHTGNLQNNSFEGLDKIKTLILDNNIMYRFDVNISHMQNLLLLNLSSTNLHTLSPDTRKALTQIRQRNKSNLTAIMTKDPIYCTCKNQDFIEWMISSPIIPKPFTGFKCVYPGQNDVLEVDYNIILSNLHKICASDVALFFGVLSATCLIMIIITVVLLYRFRWKIRYFYYLTLLLYRGDKKSTSNSYDYDVFISYSEADEDFAEGQIYRRLQDLGLSCYIQGLHFGAGSYISTNIVEAVRICRRTLVVMTKNFLQSEWGRFEVEMANIEGLNSNRPVLMFLMVDNLDRQDLSTEVLFYIQRNILISYPSDKLNQQQVNMEHFWRNLAADIRS